MLRGMGATLALPFLEAMRPLGRAATTAKSPVRLGVLFMPNGVVGLPQQLSSIYRKWSTGHKRDAAAAPVI